MIIVIIMSASVFIGPKFYDFFSCPILSSGMPTLFQIGTSLEVSKKYQTYGAVQEFCQSCGCKLRYKSNKSKTDGFILHCKKLKNEGCGKYFSGRPEWARGLSGTLAQLEQMLYCKCLRIADHSICQMFGIVNLREFNKRYCIHQILMCYMYMWDRLFLTLDKFTGHPLMIY